MESWTRSVDPRRVPAPSFSSFCLPSFAAGFTRKSVHAHRLYSDAREKMSAADTKQKLAGAEKREFTHSSHEGGDLVDPNGPNKVQ